MPQPRYEIEFEMREPSTQKLLLAMTCAFGVALVLIGYGRQKDGGFEQSNYRSNSISAKPKETSSSQPPSATHQNHQAWQSTPAPVTPNRQSKYADAGQLSAPASSWKKQTLVENYFDSSPLESSAHSRQKTQHPIAQRYAHGRQLANQAASPRHQTWPTQNPNQVANTGYVQQAVATTPIQNGVSNYRRTDFESLPPMPDFSTRPQHNHGRAPRLPANRSTTAPSEKVISKPQPVPHKIASLLHTTAPNLSSPQSLPEPQTSPINSTPIRIDKRIRKANWAEIETAPAPDVKVARRPLQQLSLPKQRATPQVEAKAHEQVRYGQSLARRRAFFAAREELIRALLLITSSYHTQANPNAYPERLAQALVALDEASDLMNFPGNNNSPLLQQTLLSHQTQLLTSQDIQTITPMKAIGIYSSFAQAQIEQAIGMSAAGSEALHALGKLESIVPETNVNQARTNQTKTLVFYRAAININPSNTICANDLGVLLYKMGRLQESEQALKTSLNSTQSQLTWNNLALVHNQLAATASTNEERNRQLSLASSATQQANRFADTTTNDQPSDGQWATTTEFQNNAAFPNVVAQNATNRPGSTAPQTGVSKSAKLKQILKEWF